MAIPTALANFDGDVTVLTREGLAELTTSGPVRFVPGPNGAPAVKGWVRNPYCQSTTYWSAMGSTREVSSDWGYRFGQSLKVTATDVGQVGLANTIPVSVGMPTGRAEFVAIVRNASSDPRTFSVYSGTGRLGESVANPGEVVLVRGGIDHTLGTSRTPRIYMDDAQIGDAFYVGYYQVTIDDEGRYPIPAIGTNDELLPGYGWEDDIFGYREAWALGGAYVAEEGTTNYDDNPISHTQKHMNNGYNHVSVSRITDAGLILPGGQRIETATRVAVTGAPGSSSLLGWSATSSPFPAIVTGTWVSHGCWIRPSPDLVGKTVSVRLSEVGGSTPSNINISTPHVLTPGWQYVKQSLQVQGDDRASVFFYVNATNSSHLVSGQSYMDFTYNQSENKPYLTSPVPQFDRDGNLLPGYSWSGVEFESPSTRQQSWAGISNAEDILRRDRGAVFIRAYLAYANTGTRGLVDTGVDNIRVYFTGGRVLRISVGATDTTVPSDRFAWDDWNDIYIGWEAGRPLSVRVNDTEEWIGGAALPHDVEPNLPGDSVIYIGRTHGGSSLNGDTAGLETFDRRLRDSEWAALRDADTWGWPMLFPQMGGIMRVDATTGPIAVLRSEDPLSPVGSVVSEGSEEWQT